MRSSKYSQKRECTVISQERRRVGARVRGVREEKEREGESERRAASVEEAEITTAERC
jgi:hypothetical protein